MNIVALLVCIGMLVILYRKYHEAVRYKVDARKRIFDDCLPLLQQATQGFDTANLPILEGIYHGYKVSLSIVEDTLGWRKIPPLWLLIKVQAKVPSKGSLDYIVRPSNNEFYSPSWQWNGSLSVPLNWPQHAIAKYQNQPVDLALVEPFILKLFADANMKELLIMPNLSRITYMVKQAERGEYLIMRNAVFENTPISQNTVDFLLMQAILVRQNVENTASHQVKKAILIREEYANHQPYNQKTASG